ncbi:MAG: alpha/beta fold hydrolase [Candidatus Eremiobacteraeota bacterium]|nr:alpha/beta fold hydrolase [Candidatus Eremiobacteraeota bacterium]
MRLALLVFALVTVCFVPAPSVGAELPRHGLLGAVLVQNAGAVGVKAVVPGSAAASAQMQPGDVIRSVNGVPMSLANDVVQAVRKLPAGTTISVVILRNGVARTVSVTLGTPRDEKDSAVRTLYQSITVQGTLRRTLLDVPDNIIGKRPGVLLIGGIGCFSVDVASNSEDGYLRISRDLARAGFVTMRLEKSGVGDSQGPPCHDVDFHDEYASYAIALEALRRDPKVDPAHIYLLGHSIGTIIAPQLALDHRVAGIVVSEAVGRNWFEYELMNLSRQLELGGDTPDVVDQKLRSKEYCMHRLLVARDPESEIEAADPECKIRNGIYPVAAPYMQQIAALNIIQPWTRISVPVLVVYGSSDYVVAPEDAERIVEVVNHGHPGLATLAEVPAMDHNLQVAATPEQFYADNAQGTPTRYQTKFSDVVVHWMCTHERLGAVPQARDAPLCQ